MSSGQDGRHGAAGRRLTGLLAVAIAISVVGSAGAAWNGQQDVSLGDNISAGFVADAPAVTHSYRFFVPAETKLKAKLLEFASCVYIMPDTQIVASIKTGSGREGKAV